MIARVQKLLSDGRGQVEGFCRDDFAPVLDAFVANFEVHGEIGASVSVSFDGETVVDLWGGLADPNKQLAWQSDTVSLVYSATKSLVGLVAGILIDRGQLDPAAPMTDVWPAFGRNGKQDATVRMAFDHSLGLPALRTPVRPDGFYDWEYMCDLIAEEAPFWEPGSEVGYHAMTWGWIVGEMMRQVTGKTFGQLLQELLAEPLGLDVWCGLPEAIEPRIAPIIAEPIGAQFGKIFERSVADDASISALALQNDGGWLSGFVTDPMTGRVHSDTRDSHAAEIPAANAITNARALAGAFRPFATGGREGGQVYAGPETLADMESISVATNLDRTTLQPTAWTVGFNKMRDLNAGRPSAPPGLALGRRAFGHSGAGGSLAFADPEFALSFGYTMNRLSKSGRVDERAESLVAALYSVVGCTKIRAGYRRRPQ